MHPDLQTPAKQILTAAELPELNCLHNAFIALGKAQYDIHGAEQTLQYIFRGQWENGMIPHFISHLQAQLPTTTGRVEIAEDTYTSSICMPPVLGFICWQIYEQASDQKAALPVLKQFYPKIYQFHQYLYDTRDPLEEGLVYLRHPQESIAAGSPDWVIGGESRVPSGMNEAMLLKSSGFSVQSPLFNALLCWSNECLIKMAFLLEEEVTELIQWQELTLHSLNEKCWNEASGHYDAYHLKNSEHLPLHGLPALLPLCGGVPTQEQAEDILVWLASAAFGAGQMEVLLCPTYSLESPGFRAEAPWGGAVSLLGNWLLYRGLKRYDMNDAASKIRKQSLNLIAHHGFSNHFHAMGKRAEDTITKSGLSAALCLDLLRT